TKATTLKGAPEMVAVKDGNEIHAPELVMHRDDPKGGQHAEAHGTGYFRGFDRAADGTGPKRTVEARWRDLMVYRREDGRDLITLTGAARFDDKENNQTLAADQIKLTMAPGE